MRSESPFRLAGGEQPLPLVPVHLNGAGPFPFILDTGAALSLVTPELAARAGIEPGDSREARGAAGRMSVSLGSAHSLAVGAAAVSDVPVAITGELHRIGAHVGAPIEGDLGHSFLRHFRVTLDYPRGTLRLLSPDEPEEEGAGSAVPFTLAHPARPLILLPVSVNGSGPHTFALDTGTSTTVVAPGLARALGVELREGPPITAGGGTIAASEGRVDSLSVGGAVSEGVGVVASDFFTGLGEAVGVRFDGIVGYNFLRDFEVTIDYPGSRLLLLRRGG